MAPLRSRLIRRVAIALLLFVVTTALSLGARWFNRTAPIEEDIRATMAAIEREAYGGAPHDPAQLERMRTLTEKMPSADMDGWIEITVPDRLDGGTSTYPETPGRIVLDASRRTPDWPVDDAAIEDARSRYRTDAFRVATDELETLLADPACRPADLHDRPERIADALLLGVPLLRSTATDQLAGAAVAVHDGRTDDALRHTELALGLARWIDRQPMLITMLIATSVESRAHRFVRSCVRAPSATEELLAGLEELLDEHDRLDDGLARTLRGERCAMIDRFEGFANLEEPEPNIITVMFGLPSLRDSAEAITGLMKRLERYAETPAHRRDAMQDSPSDFAATLPDDHAPLLLLLPPMEKAIRTDTALRQERDLARLLIALRRYTLSRGAPPERLDELVTAGLLPAMPEDTMTPDGRFRYTRDASVPLGFRLYSVGPDHTDNSGRAPEDFQSQNYVYSVPPGFDFWIEPELRESKSPTRSGAGPGAFMPGSLSGDLARLVRSAERPEGLDLTVYRMMMTGDGTERTAHGSYDLDVDRSALAFARNTIARWPAPEGENAPNDLFADRLFDAYRTEGFTQRLSGGLDAGRGAGLSDAVLGTLSAFEFPASAEALRARDHAQVRTALRNVVRLDALEAARVDVEPFRTVGYDNGLRLFAELESEIDAEGARIVASILNEQTADFDPDIDAQARFYADVIRLLPQGIGMLNLLSAMGGEEGIRIETEGNEQFYVAALDWNLATTFEERLPHHERMAAVRDQLLEKRGEDEDGLLMHPVLFMTTGIFADAGTLAFAIHAYTLEHGGAPTTLDRLVESGILHDLPPDRCAPWRAYGYRVDPALPRGYALYSVWTDLRDNNGREYPTDENEGMWATGYDASLTRFLHAAPAPE